MSTVSFILHHPKRHNQSAHDIRPPRDCQDTLPAASVSSRVDLARRFQEVMGGQSCWGKRPANHGPASPISLPPAAIPSPTTPSLQKACAGI